jgi:uncharacterized alkaline shock family protein YloU
VTEPAAESGSPTAGSGSVAVLTSRDDDPSAGEPSGATVGPAGSRLPAPAERGRLELSERAVGRLVAAAAAEVDGVGGAVSRVLGQALGSADADARPRATVTRAGDLVTAEVSLSVVWPAPVPEVAARVRERVGEQLSRLAGLRLSHIDITITALTSRAARRRVS